MIDVRIWCDEHPNYRALRKPTTDKDCVCQLLYYFLHEHWRLTGFAKNELLRVERIND